MIHRNLAANRMRSVFKDAEKAAEELTEKLQDDEEKTGIVQNRERMPEDQALAFSRPQIFSLTALHETPPAQGLFYRQDGRAFLRLWLKNACNVELLVDQERLIFLEVERNLWELSLGLEAGFYYVTLTVDGVEVLSPFLPIGYGCSRPCNYLDIGPIEPCCELREVPHGTVRHEYFFSSVLERTASCLVYTPPGYEAGAGAYPALYLQHGFGENETGWIWQGRIGYMMDNLLSEGKAAPMLIVMADGMVRETDGQEEKLVHQKFVPFLLEDLIPFVEKRYRVLADADHRAAAGLSMGSMQASMAAFPHPELFGWIGLFSGFMRNYIGVEDVDSEHLSLLLADPEAFSGTNRLLFRAMGKQDVFFASFMEEDQLCEDYQIRHVRRVYEGGHDWNVWRKCANEFLQLLFRETGEL